MFLLVRLSTVQIAPKQEALVLSISTRNTLEIGNCFTVFFDFFAGLVQLKLDKLLKGTPSNRVYCRWLSQCDSAWYKPWRTVFTEKINIVTRTTAR